MCGGIESNRASADRVSQKLKDGLSEYVSFSVEKIAEYAPVGGNNTHDGTVADSIVDALAAWSDVIEEDSAAVISASAGFENADEEAAAKMLGVSD